MRHELLLFNVHVNITMPHSFVDTFSQRRNLLLKKFCAVIVFISHSAALSDFYLGKLNA